MAAKLTTPELLDKLCLEVCGSARKDIPEVTDEVILNDAILVLRDRKAWGGRLQQQIIELTTQLEAKAEQTFTPQDLFIAATLVGSLISSDMNQTDSVKAARFALSTSREVCKGRNPS